MRAVLVDGLHVDLPARRRASAASSPPATPRASRMRRTARPTRAERRSRPRPPRSRASSVIASRSALAPSCAWGRSRRRIVVVLLAAHALQSPPARALEHGVVPLSTPSRASRARSGASFAQRASRRCATVAGSATGRSRAALAGANASRRRRRRAVSARTSVGVGRAEAREGARRAGGASRASSCFHGGLYRRRPPRRRARRLRHLSTVAMRTPRGLRRAADGRRQPPPRSCRWGGRTLEPTAATSFTDLGAPAREAWCASAAREVAQLAVPVSPTPARSGFLMPPTARGRARAGLSTPRRRREHLPQPIDQRAPWITPYSETCSSSWRAAAAPVRDDMIITMFARCSKTAPPFRLGDRLALRVAAASPVRAAGRLGRPRLRAAGAATWSVRRGRRAAQRKKRVDARRARGDAARGGSSARAATSVAPEPRAATRRRRRRAAAAAKTRPRRSCARSRRHRRTSSASARARAADGGALGRHATPSPSSRAHVAHDAIALMLDWPAAARWPRRPRGRQSRCRCA